MPAREEKNGDILNSPARSGSQFLPDYAPFPLRMIDLV